MGQWALKIAENPVLGLVPKYAWIDTGFTIFSSIRLLYLIITITAVSQRVYVVLLSHDPVVVLDSWYLFRLFCHGHEC